MAHGHDFCFGKEEGSNSNSHFIIIPYFMKTNQLLNPLGNNRSESAAPFLDSQ